MAFCIANIDNVALQMRKNIQGSKLEIASHNSNMLATIPEHIEKHFILASFADVSSAAPQSIILHGTDEIIFLTRRHWLGGRWCRS